MNKHDNMIQTERDRKINNKGLTHKLYRKEKKIIHSWLNSFNGHYKTQAVVLLSLFPSVIFQPRAMLVKTQSAKTCELGSSLMCHHTYFVQKRRIVYYIPYFIQIFSHRKLEHLPVWNVFMQYNVKQGNKTTLVI